MARWRGITAATGTLLLALAAWLAGNHATVGDTYCGSPFYDSYRNGRCGDRLAVLGTLAVTCLVVGLSALVLAWLGGQSSTAWLRTLPVIVLGLLALSLGLVAVHSMVDPTRHRWCGSVVNRHRTYEPDIERDCDRILRPNVKTAAGAGLGASLATGAAIALRPRRPSPELSGSSMPSSPASSAPPK